MTLRLAATMLVLCVGAAQVHAQTKPATGRPAVPAAPVVEQGPAWGSLKPAQREALKPLERDWAGIDAPRKSKWLEIAERYPTMAPQDQARLQTRMTEWAKMTPQERSQTRLHYQEAKQVPAQDRQASWEAYQALPPDQRREYANRAAPVAASAPAPTSTRATTPPRPDSLVREGPQPKSNAVPEPTPALQPKPVAPSVMQAKPGATTTLISKPATPPAHQPTGMPKIAATPEYVDKKTLLPQTGAQSTAATAPAKPANATPPARP